MNEYLDAHCNVLIARRGWSVGDGTEMGVGAFDLSKHTCDVCRIVKESKMKQIVVSALVSLFVLGFSTVALADHELAGHERGSDYGRAPEPVTMIGLGLGAAGVGVAGWVKRRSKRNP